MEYTKLDVWVESRKLTNLVYEISKQFPKEEIYGLTSQIRKSAVAVPSNIAEGCGSQTAKDTMQHLHISRGSLFDLETQCYLVLDQKYINQTQFEEVFILIQSCMRLLNGFINYYKLL